MYSDDTRPFPFPPRLIRKETVGYARLGRMAAVEDEVVHSRGLRGGYMYLQGGRSPLLEVIADRNYRFL